MSDARDKLQAAIAAQKKKEPAPAPKAKAAPAKAPPPAAPSRRSAAPSTPKPEKSKSSFLKKKKKKPKKAAQKKSSGGGSAFGSAFGKLAKNFVDELKEATSEISPGQLIETAKGGISTLGGLTKQDESDAAEESKAKAKGSASPDAGSQPTSSSGNEGAGGATEAPATNGGASGAAAEPPKEFSTVKVQKAPPARRKGKSKPQVAAPTAADAEPGMVVDEAPTADVAAEAETASEAPGETAADALLGTDDETPAAGSEPASEESVATSPAKASRAPKKKTKSTEPEPEAAEEPVGIIDDDAPEPREPEEEQAVETVSESSAEGEPEESAAAEEPVGQPEAKKGSSKRRPKKAAKQAVHVSKEEQLVRAFHSLHCILNSEIWKPIATHVDSKPSSIFAPRNHFDKQWATPAFREGLKAASRLASGYTFDPAGIEFDERAIQAVQNYAFDPEGMIKPHTELITKAIGSKKTDEVLELIKKGKVRQLLYSVGTRLSTFVPTIEILARIYIGLRKKEDIIPGDRLQIQEEVLMKYNKSPYSEDMGKKARNLSLNYFMDYLTEYGFKLYTDRLNQAPDGQNHLGAQKRRHETIKESCTNLVREWGVKVGISSPAMMNLEGRLMEMADNHLAALVGETPDDE